MRKENSTALRNGIRDGMPIGIGYAAVAFSLGIAMRNAGMNAFQGFLISMLNMASAGEYAGVQVIMADAAYIEMALVTLIANARYMLMSTALSQRFSEKTAFFHRLIVGYCITDELFGIAINQEGYLNPFYYYGALLVAIPGWSFGTALGIIAGNVLPARIVSALSVALYGMFLAIIIPPARKDKIVAATVISGFALSWCAPYIPFLKDLNAGMKTIVLTLVIASLAAYFFPHQEEDSNEA